MQAQTIIIGAGVIGSSVAMHLAKLGRKNITVIDFDLEGPLSSTELNAGGVRGTWFHPLNIQMSKDSIEYFASVADEVGYRACGYLWLLDDKNADFASKALVNQKQCGWDVQWWDVPELKEKVPFIDKTADLKGAVFGVNDGLINPNLLKQHYRNIARSMGVEFLDRTILLGAKKVGDSIELETEHYDRVIPLHARMDVLQGKDTGLARTRTKWIANEVVNCAGPWAQYVAERLGYSRPCKPVRRQVCIFDCRDVDLTKYGMIVDTSGVYFHPEATNGLAGFAIHDEMPGVNFDYDGEAFFNEYIWSKLYERSSAFERLKHLTGWAGLYEVSPDDAAMIGPVDDGRLFEAHSFSGHGVMHSYSAGRGLAEYMVHGKYKSLDLSMFSGGRFNLEKQTGHLILERFVI